MKRLQLLRWSGSVLSPRIRPSWRTACLEKQYHNLFVRQQSSAAATVSRESNYGAGSYPEHDLPLPPSPPADEALRSPRLAALHARLALPEKLPLQTLARTLVDCTADPSPQFNNRAFYVLGHDLLAFYTSEYLVCSYPRLPTTVLWSAMYSYIGEKTLSVMAKEWGIEAAAEPGCEVDPGLLQFKRLPPGTTIPSRLGDKDENGYRRGKSARIVNDDAFGEGKEDPEAPKLDGITANRARANFVRALMGALYLHGGRPAAKKFFEDHFMSRELPVGDLFSFAQPARDLSKLCAREGFERPVARILSETGRLSRHPVFNVGIFSGKDKLGEGAGSSLTEARFRAAAAALKAWYVYSPVSVRVPSSMEEKNAKPWDPVLVDPGEIIV